MDGQNAWNPKAEPWKNHLNIAGAQWYRYTDLRVDLADVNRISDLSHDNQPQSVEIPTDFTIIPGYIDSQIIIPKIQSGSATLQLLNHAGTILHQNVDDTHNSVKLNMKKIEPGVYFLSLLRESVTQHFRIAVQR